VTTVRKVTVLVPDEEFKRFESYCAARGYKKSTLIMRLIREHLDRESFEVQRQLPFDRASEEGGR
jgi:hypothetical protein